MARPRKWETDEERKAARREACKKYDQGPKRRKTRHARKSLQAIKADQSPPLHPVRKAIQEAFWKSQLAVNTASLALIVPPEVAGHNTFGLLARKIRFTPQFLDAFERPVKPTALIQWVQEATYDRPQVETRLYDISTKAIRDTFNGYHLRNIVDSAIRRLACKSDESQLEVTASAITDTKAHWSALEKVNIWIDVHKATHGSKAAEIANWWRYWQWQAILVLRNELHMRWLYNWSELEPIILEGGWLWQKGWTAHPEVRDLIWRTSHWSLVPGSSDELSESETEDELSSPSSSQF